MGCFVCSRSTSELKRLMDLDFETKQIFFLISNVSNINNNDYLCKVCLSLLQAAAAFREVCAASDECFSRQSKKVAPSVGQGVENDPLPNPFQSRQSTVDCFGKNSFKPPETTNFVNITNFVDPQALDFIKNEPEENVPHVYDEKPEVEQNENDNRFNPQNFEQKVDDDSDFYRSDDDWNMSVPAKRQSTSQTKSIEESHCTCDICGKTVKSLRTLEKHFISIHKQPDPRDITAIDIEKLENDDEARIFPKFNNMGRGYLVHRGYRYTWNSDGNTSIHWKCVVRKQCNVRVRIHKDISNGVILLNVPGSHTHEPDLRKHLRKIRSDALVPFHRTLKSQTTNDRFEDQKKDENDLDSNNVQIPVVQPEQIEVPQYTCDTCGKLFKTLRSLERHFIGVHKLPDPRDTSGIDIDEIENEEIPRIFPAFNNRGRGFLVHKGYRYTLNNENNSRVQWKCTDRKHCKVSVRTNKDFSNRVVIVGQTGRHTHEPDVRKYLRKINKDALIQVQSMSMSSSQSGVQLS